MTTEQGIKKVSLESGEYLLVKVPEENSDLAYFYFFIGTDNKLYGNWGQIDNHVCDLPPGNWTIIGKGSDLSEQQMKEITPKGEDGLYIVFGDAFDEPEHSRILATTNIEKAFNSLIKSYGLEPNECIILKLENNE